MGDQSNHCYFEKVGEIDGWERFIPTDHTVSGWGDDLQHGSPPSAILTRAVERCAPDPTKRLTRIAVDILGAVPMTEVRTRARVSRPGRQIELIDADLVARGPDGEWRPVARASAWRMLTEDTKDIEMTFDKPVCPVEDANAGLAQLKAWPGGFIASLECRQGDPIVPGGHRVSWVRSPFPLVGGETPSPTEYMMNIVDVANGVGAKVDHRAWMFMNTDLTVHLHRIPRGEWIGVAAETSTGPDGVGMCAGVIYDAEGPFGRTQQTLLVRRR